MTHDVGKYFPLLFKPMVKMLEVKFELVAKSVCLANIDSHMAPVLYNFLLMFLAMSSRSML